MSVRELIFVDVESGGLECETDPLVELTWARMYDEPKTLWFGVEEVSPFIDDFIKFTERGIAGRLSNVFEVNDFLKASDGQTMVASNPSFDQGFLKANGLWRFHYRMLDIESYAMSALGLDFVPSTKEIFDFLTADGYKITEPNHTSRNDVLAIRDAYKALLEY